MLCVVVWVVRCGVLCQRCCYQMAMVGMPNGKMLNEWAVNLCPKASRKPYAPAARGRVPPHEQADVSSGLP